MWWQNLNYSIYLGALLGGLLLILIVEALRHRYYRNSIPFRIHVNGTRGKSSVTRLIAAGLRAGGLKTCAKTTGTLARFILPDGSEESIYRIGATNVLEQIYVIRRAAQYQAQALVIECMALQPLLQSLCELRLVRSTHGVLTNVRPDHLEIMGPSEKDVALALAGTIPCKGKYFTTERKHRNTLKKAALDRRSKMFSLTAAQVEEVTAEELAKFSYTEFKENVALALAVCSSLGIEREVALPGMWQALPDPGVLIDYSFYYQNHPVIFANGFAANDPVSTQVLWNNLLLKYFDCPFTVLIVNCRKDRPERSAQLGEEILKWAQPNAILLIGSGTAVFEHHYFKGSQGVKTPLTLGEEWDVEQILAWIATQTQQKTLLVGIGNIAGIGLQLIEYCRNASLKNKG